MFKPEITSHADHGVEAQSIYIEGHGYYDVATVTLALVTEFLASMTTPELRKAMTRNYRDSEGVSAELAKVRRAELVFMAAEYPTLYVPRMVQVLGLECDREGRYWLPSTMLCASCREDTPRATVVEVPGPVEGMPLFVCPPCAAKPSPFVADPASPTDDEIAAAVERGIADGSIITAEQFLASAARHGHATTCTAHGGRDLAACDPADCDEAALAASFTVSTTYPATPAQAAEHDAAGPEHAAWCAGPSTHQADATAYDATIPHHGGDDAAYQSWRAEREETSPPLWHLPPGRTQAGHGLAGPPLRRPAHRLTTDPGT